MTSSSELVGRFCFFFFQAEDGIRDLVRSRGLGDVYKRQPIGRKVRGAHPAWKLCESSARFRVDS